MPAKDRKTLKIKVHKALYRLRHGLPVSRPRHLLLSLAAGAASLLPASAAGQQNQSNQKDSFANEQTATGQPQTYSRMVEVNIRKEVNNRAQWFVDEYLKATAFHLQNIQTANKNGRKADYVKGNFFNVVYPGNRFSGRTPYCITAINRALIDANKFGDLNCALPDYKNEGENAVECKRFAAYLSNRGFDDCIKYGLIQIDELTPGDIILTPRGGGMYHATTYIGNGKVRSFNRDGEWKLQRNTGVIIKTRRIAEKAILYELHKQQLVDLQKGNIQIIPLDQAQKMMQMLYRGRTPTQKTKTLAFQLPTEEPVIFAKHFSARSEHNR